MGLWSKKKEENALVPIEQGSGVKRAGALVPVDDDTDLVVYENRKATSIALGAPRGGALVQVRSKALKIDGKVYNVDPRQLIRMIKQVTQTIGEYKSKDNPYSGYVIGALRKARSDMVSDLEHHFNILWEIDEATGRSVFYMG